MLRSKRGFTLVELIVVLVIMAILAAILIPSLIGWIDKARENIAISECLSVVQTARIIAIEEYAQGKSPTSDLNYLTPKISEYSGVSGTILDVRSQTNSPDIARMSYHASNGKYVLYEDNKCTVSDEKPNEYNVTGYTNTSNNLLSQVQSQTGNVWENLRNAYKQQYGGVYPNISAEEKLILSRVSTVTLSSLTWKPTILGSNGSEGVMLIASNGTSVNNAYLIYYNGNYYYHDNGNGKMDSAWVSDQGSFDVSQLTNYSGVGSHWVKVG